MNIIITEQANKISKKAMLSLWGYGLFNKNQKARNFAVKGTVTAALLANFIKLSMKLDGGEPEFIVVDQNMPENADVIESDLIRYLPDIARMPIIRFNNGEIRPNSNREIQKARQTVAAA